MQNACMFMQKSYELYNRTCIAYFYTSVLFQCSSSKVLHTTTYLYTHSHYTTPTQFLLLVHVEQRAHTGKSVSVCAAKFQFMHPQFQL